MKVDITTIVHSWDLNLKDKSEKTSINNLDIDTFTSKLFSVGPHYFYVIDFFDLSISHVSEDIGLVHNIKKTDPIHINQILELIHPEDIEYVSQVEANLGELFKNELGLHNLLNYKVSYNIRMKNKDDDYSLINHQSIMLTIDENDCYGKSLNIHTDISHICTHNTKTFSLIGLNGEPSFLNLNLNTKEINTLKLSVREIQILLLISNGLTNEDISEKLNISIHTVKSHRKNMLKNAENKNMSQLIKEATIQGII